MKFRIIVTFLTIAIIVLFGLVIYFSFQLKHANTTLSDIIAKYEEAGLKIENLESENSKALIKYANLINEGTKDKWEIASGTNTLAAYSMFVENCNGEVEDCHQTDLENAINTLLNADGYVEFVETNGNKLYTEVNFSLEGKFVKFNKDKNVRNGAIGIDNCGSPDHTSTGDIVSKNRIVKVLDECNAPGSQSVWAHIQYTK